MEDQNNRAVKVVNLGFFWIYGCEIDMQYLTVKKKTHDVISEIILIIIVDHPYNIIA